jgi:polyprenyl-phospho-N-acetylgalactosaminyl synthase
MLNNKVWIVIPAHNEAKNIGNVLQQLAALTANVVVVNDDSTDQTARIVSDFQVQLLNHLVNRGQGAALQTGTEFALQNGAEIIVHFDADGQMQIKDIVKVIDPILNNDAEIVFGSRFLTGDSKIPWTKRYFILLPAKLFNWVFTGVRLTDAHCGFRALSKKAALAIEIRQDGMAHATEIMDQVRLLNLRYQEVPVEIIYNEYGQGFGKGFKIILDLIIGRLTKK